MDIARFDKAQGFVEEPLRFFIVGQENDLANSRITLQNPLDEPMPDSRALGRGPNEDVLDVANRLIVGDSPGQTDESAVSITGGDDKTRAGNRPQQRPRVIRVERPPDAEVEIDELVHTGNR